MDPIPVATPWYADWSFWTLIVTILFSSAAIYLRVRKEQRDQTNSLKEKIDGKASNGELQRLENKIDALPTKDYVAKEAGRARGTADQAMQRAEDAVEVRSQVLGMVAKMATDTADVNTKIAEIKNDVSDKYVDKETFRLAESKNSEEHKRIHERIDGGMTRHD